MFKIYIAFDIIFFCAVLDSFDRFSYFCVHMFVMSRNFGCFFLIILTSSHCCETFWKPHLFVFLFFQIICYMFLQNYISAASSLPFILLLSNFHSTTMIFSSLLGTSYSLGSSSCHKTAASPLPTCYFTCTCFWFWFTYELTFRCQNVHYNDIELTLVFVFHFLKLITVAIPLFVFSFIYLREGCHHLYRSFTQRR